MDLVEPVTTVAEGQLQRAGDAVPRAQPAGARSGGHPYIC
jgi:hypothetical protein